MNRTLESRILRLEKDADMSSLRHLTDEELDKRVIEELRTVIAGHSSVMSAVDYFRSADDADQKAIGDMLDEHMPMIREVIERQFPTAA